MPDRFLKRVDGLHGGTLIVAGIVYALLGVTWWVAPSAARLAGIDWTPWTFINDTSVGALWACVGLLSITVGVISVGRRRLTNVAFFLDVFVPSLIALYFAFAFFLGESPRTLITTVSYLGYAALVGWVGSRPDPERIL